MKNYSTNLLVLGLLACTPCFAQRAARSSECVDGPGMLTESGDLVYDVPVVPSLFATIAPPASVVATGIDIPGGCSGWLVGSTYHYLCSGAMVGGVGVVQHWSWDSEGASPPALLNSRYFPGQDISSVAYDPAGQQLYLHDAVASVLRSSAWDGSSGLPSAFQTILNATQCSELAAPASCQLRAREKFGSGTYELLLERWRPAGFPPGQSASAPVKRIDTSTVPATTTTLTLADGSLGVAIVPESLQDGQTTALLRVSLTSTDTFEIYDADSLTLLGSATSPGGVNILPITSSSPFVVGRNYVPRRVGDALVPERSIECLVHYGADSTTPLGVTLGGVRILPILEVGEQNYQITLASHVTCTNPALADSLGMLPLAGYFAYDFRNPVTGQDPIGQSNGQTVLMTSNFIPAKGLIWHVPGTGLMSVASITMPHDPALHGIVIFFQAVYIEGSQAYVSRIHGMMMTDS